MGVRIGVDREGARQDFYRPSSPLAPLIDIILHAEEVVRGPSIVAVNQAAATESRKRRGRRPAQWRVSAATVAYRLVACCWRSPTASLATALPLPMGRTDAAGREQGAAPHSGRSGGGRLPTRTQTTAQHAFPHARRRRPRVPWQRCPRLQAA